MHRILGLLALTAVGLGVYLLLSGPEPDPIAAAPHALDGSPTGYSGWAIGLVMGLALAWLAGIQWSSLPERLGAWLQLQRRRIGLVILGGLFAAVLLLF